MCYKLASTTSLVQCPAASPETQKLTKDAGLIKRHILSPDSMSQFPPHYGSPKESPAQSWSLTQGSGHVCTRHTGASPWQNGSTFLGSNPFSTGTHSSVQAVGCQHPACHPGSGPCSVGSPQSQQALTLLSLKDLLSCKEAQEEKKKPPILPCSAAEPAMEATNDSFQVAP